MRYATLGEAAARGYPVTDASGRRVWTPPIEEEPMGQPNADTGDEMQSNQPDADQPDVSTGGATLQDHGVGVGDNADPQADTQEQVEGAPEDTSVESAMAQPPQEPIEGADEGSSEPQADTTEPDESGGA